MKDTPPPQKKREQHRFVHYLVCWTTKSNMHSVSQGRACSDNRVICFDLFLWTGPTSRPLSQSLHWIMMHTYMLVNASYIHFPSLAKLALPEAEQHLITAFFPHCLGFSLCLSNTVVTVGTSKPQTGIPKALIATGCLEKVDHSLWSTTWTAQPR